MLNCQEAVLDDVPLVGRYVFYSLASSDREVIVQGLSRLADVVNGERVLAGLGLELVQLLGAHVPGLRGFQNLTGLGVAVPATPSALCCWLRGDDLGDLMHLTRDLQRALADAFMQEKVIDAFRYGRGPNGYGRDLTGYEDGTENPVDEAAVAAALLQGGGPGLDGSSFVSIQQWVHNLDAFESMSPLEQDDTYGRSQADNEELDDAPESAHVKRAAQESFAPEAFMVRRSMPWVQGAQAGLVFVAFGHSLDAFEMIMRRMAGLEDGVVDALFRISRPVTGANFWCPPVLGGRLDLRQIGL
jgi:putative iron-dependent peroxidase